MQGVPFNSKLKTKKKLLGGQDSDQVPKKNSFHNRNISFDNRDLNTCSATTFDPLLEKISPQILSIKLKEAQANNVRLPNV